MYGAIIGDIVGSPYEFDQGNKTKDFEFFNDACRFTDDTVMTVAIAEALIKAKEYDASATLVIFTQISLCSDIL